MRRVLLLLTLLFCGLAAFSQGALDKVKWTFDAKQTGDSTFTVTVVANIEPGWHIYTASPGGDGSQIPTIVTLHKNNNIRLDGKMQIAGKVVDEEVEDVGIIHYYKNKVTYTQKLVARANTSLKGNVSFQVCDDKMCLPPKDLDFSVKIDGLKITATDTTAADTSLAATDTSVTATPTPDANNDTAAALSDAATISGPNNTLEKSSLGELFLAGLVAGFIAFIMPCIYAMLPITVSFFTKRSKDRATGLKNATFYSLSIIFIFTAIGALVSLLFTEKTMYELSTSMGFNLFVFALFVIFGISLLGAFEITLPASWSSKLDSKANSNSFGGIFFMALVLVVVSFSCTSAFISSLIVYIVNSGNSLGGIVGFFGFGLAIALPFALGAFFPGLLNNIAKSGGWLNTVKVTMGFLELAMAMKFLSNVDLQYHWHLLDFEIYLAIWIVIFGLLGFYLLGKLRFSHDDELPRNMFGHTYLSVTRLFFAIAALAFTAYLIPGLWGAPLSGISGFLPERKTLDFNVHDNLINIQSRVGGGEGDNNVRPVKYADNLKSELPGITAFFDYEEALKAAKKTGKPLLLDFTGHSCVNCRKMERAVLSKPDVLRQLNENFIVASLYCDDKTPLPENERYTAKDGSQIKTLGAKNLDLELTKYGAVAQPLYIFVDGDGNLLKDAGGYEPDVQRFLNILNEVQEAHKKGHQ
jgi:thiol:disulfide interchange protein